MIDYDRLEENAALFRPKLLVSFCLLHVTFYLFLFDEDKICGASAYPREWDYQRLRKVADKHGAYLLSDMAHIGGLVAAQVCP